MTQPYIHHGVMFSYYSAKTRAYLSYKRLPFVEQYHAPTLSGRLREITHKVMIPVVETPDGEVLQDTTEIIDILETRHPQRPVLPREPLQLLLSRITEFIMDELWITTSMNSRWNDPRSKAFVVGEFGRVIGGSAGLPEADAMQMGETVAGQMQSYLPFLGISEAPAQQLTTAFFQQASLALNEVVGAHKFALGPRPSLIDLCLFTGYYAHQYRDAGDAQEFLKAQTPQLCYFLDSLHAAQCAPDAGELTIEQPLLDYLAFVGPPGAAFASGILDGTADIAVNTQPAAVCEGAVPPFRVPLGEGEIARGGSVFSAWKAQRVLDVHASMSPEQRAEAEPILSAIGWDGVVGKSLPYRLERADYQIRLKE